MLPTYAGGNSFGRKRNGNSLVLGSLGIAGVLGVVVIVLTYLLISTRSFNASLLREVNTFKYQASTMEQDLTRIKAQFYHKEHEFTALDAACSHTRQLLVEANKQIRTKEEELNQKDQGHASEKDSIQADLQHQVDSLSKELAATHTQYENQRALATTCERKSEFLLSTHGQRENDWRELAVKWREFENTMRAENSKLRLEVSALEADMTEAAKKLVEAEAIAKQALMKDEEGVQLPPLEPLAHPEALLAQQKLQEAAAAAAAAVAAAESAAAASAAAASSQQYQHYQQAQGGHAVHTPLIPRQVDPNQHHSDVTHHADVAPPARDPVDPRLAHVDPGSHEAAWEDHHVHEDPHAWDSHNPHHDETYEEPFFAPDHYWVHDGDQGHEYEPLGPGGVPLHHVAPPTGWAASLHHHPPPPPPVHEDHAWSGNEWHGHGHPPPPPVRNHWGGWGTPPAHHGEEPHDSVPSHWGGHPAEGQGAQYAGQPAQGDHQEQHGQEGEGHDQHYRNNLQWKMGW